MVTKMRFNLVISSIVDEAKDKVQRGTEAIAPHLLHLAQAFWHTTFSPPLSIDEMNVAILDELYQHYFSGMSLRTDNLGMPHTFLLHSLQLLCTDKSEVHGSALVAHV